jgi:hypothetical protein
MGMNYIRPELAHELPKPGREKQQTRRASWTTE